jgi:hypothetical protein
MVWPFGKRRSDTENAMINVGQLYLLNQVDNLDHDSAKSIASAALDLAIEVARRDFGDSMHEQHLGARMLASPMGQARLKAGVTAEEIETYWNQALLLVVLNDQLEVARLSACMKVMGSKGESEQDIYKWYMIWYPRFAMPETWKQDAPLNKAYSAVDAPLFPELRPRVERWIEKVGINGARGSAYNYTSFNAMIRAFIAEGRL